MPIRPAALFVLLVWAGMLVWALAFVGTWAERFPIADELDLWSLLPPHGEFTWKTLLHPHNEHFIPLPRLLEFVLFRITGDLRAAMLLEVAILGAISLALILTARGVRGRTEWTDVLFPLLLLHTGNASNLLNGFQLAFTLPTAIASGILAAAAISPALPRPARAVWIGIGLVALPLCGGAGSLQAPALMVWLAWAGWRGIRSAEPSERSGGSILLAAVALVFAACLAGVLSVAATSVREVVGPWGVASRHAAALLALAIGPAARDAWPASAWLAPSLVAATIWVLSRRGSSESFRRLGILASMTGVVCLALATSAVRARDGWESGLSLRYILLTAPLLCGIHLAWVVYGGRVWGGRLGTLLALIAIAALPWNARDGVFYARGQRRKAEELEALVRKGASVSEIVRAYSGSFQPDPRRSLTILEVLAQERRPPFDVGPEFPPARFEFAPLDRAPSSIESAEPTALRLVDGRFALLVAGGTRIGLPLHPEDRKFSAHFAVPGPLAERPGFPGVGVRIQLAPAHGPPQTLCELELDPRARESDRGLQTVEIELPSHGECELWLTTETSWLYWMDVAIRGSP